MKIHNAIKNYVLKLDKKFGFTEVLTPHFGEKKLYEISGHLAHYQDTMFNPIKMENEFLIARPMTCPHHIMLYNSTRHSYRDFPIRYSEQSRLYRYEKSGALSGLERVRSMDLTEGHVFVRPDQIKNEFKHLYKMITTALKDFNQLDDVQANLANKINKTVDSYGGTYATASIKEITPQIFSWLRYRIQLGQEMKQHLLKLKIRIISWTVLNRDTELKNLEREKDSYSVS